jgi:hypothetical protein
LGEEEEVGGSVDEEVEVGEVPGLWLSREKEGGRGEGREEGQLEASKRNELSRKITQRTESRRTKPCYDVSIDPEVTLDVGGEEYGDAGEGSKGFPREVGSTGRKGDRGRRLRAGLETKTEDLRKKGGGGEEGT